MWGNRIVPSIVSYHAKQLEYQLYLECVPVVFATLSSKLFIDQSLTPSYYTHAVLGGASPMQQIDTELTVSSVVASAAVTALLTFPRLKNSVVQQTRNSLSALCIQSNTNHLLHYLLPLPTVASQHYDMRPRTHNRQLPVYGWAVCHILINEYCYYYCYYYYYYYYYY